MTPTRLVAAALAAGVLAIAFAVAQGVAARYSIPSGSMKPTLLPGDVVTAIKYTPGTAPARGDVVAFRLASEPQTTFVMRIVGMPGERVQVVHGVLTIDGVAVKRERLADFADTEDGQAIKVRRWRETLPNGVSHDTLDLVDDGALDNTAAFTVPAGSLFVLGDNRDNAQDSRLPRVGFVPIDDVIGYIKR
jgi:signal peptidase I